VGVVHDVGLNAADVGPAIVYDTVGELTSVDLREGKGIGSTENKPKTISAKET
jgi:hypothetical protein